MPTPAERGFRMPLETGPHERCLLSWPTQRRFDFWRGHLEAAREDYAIVARTINEFEPVLVIADEGEGADAERWLGGAVEVIELPIDDSWIRDNGPIILTDGRGGRLAAHFGFNAWGERIPPWDRDAAVAAALCEHLGIERHPVPFILEGGSIATDGEGTLVTTEQCLLNPNRNPTMTKAEIEAGLRANLGVDRVIWLENGLADDETSGHVDNVVSFIEPGRVLLQSTTEADDPDAASADANRRTLEAHGIEVHVVEVLPHDDCFGDAIEIPYVNHYPANGAIIVPLAGAAADAAVRHDLAACYPGREIVGVPGRVLAYGGGGVHCITQPVPAVTGTPA